MTVLDGVEVNSSDITWCNILRMWARSRNSSRTVKSIQCIQKGASK